MTLQEICEDAARVGREIDLTGCDYGPHKTSNQYIKHQPYYYFLAGFVRSQGVKKILEIGTNYGGSMLAMIRGANAESTTLDLVTIDKIDIAGPELLKQTSVARIVGDSLAGETSAAVQKQITGPIDLLFIDSKHSYEHATGNFRIYSTMLQPRFVIFDDIRFNEEMAKVWAELSERFDAQAYDASEIARRKDGFGVLRLR